MTTSLPLTLTLTLSFAPRVEIPTPQRLANPADPPSDADADSTSASGCACAAACEGHGGIPQPAEQRFFQRALRHAGVVEVRERRAHAGRCVGAGSFTGVAARGLRLEEGAVGG